MAVRTRGDTGFYRAAVRMDGGGCLCNSTLKMVRISGCFVAKMMALPSAPLIRKGDSDGWMAKDVEVSPYADL